MSLTTTQAIEKFSELSSHDAYLTDIDKLVTELKFYHNNDNYRPFDEIISQAVVDYVQETFGELHSVFIEKVTSDIEYDLDFV